ncbi:hypothetical protein VF04_04210 [Nostoc linckia z7]|uniref:Uncharacterized protein n=2 Tax=Nostoc linckia TaxID=92942 RepID=A0A9Q5ZG27_NOSLI|nr:hypothetical protein [Nostoc linckia]PHK42917.1 hypothetical protein VF12_00910 [Nostoc linckia z15]PHK48074.1 hypothetical protein VF13_01885 [Nostoc linckia z16]PHJ64994.1 hypothetical protein VF02_11695 [Nostoc linckia z1]PHJ70172.1 hypothetical protein VF05_11855 [Nostoc linckia z3]PHJ75073.1 hypothetical protein VF03_12015 [Nostoc linckia z2]
MVATPANSELTLEKVTAAIALILEELGEPQNEAQRQGLSAYKSGNQTFVKRLSLVNPTDYFLKSLGYLGGALKLTPNTDTILAESLRAAVDHRREAKLQELGFKIGEILD